jgi:cation diffusion facilitator CzcD-associated flavoprotein CzcO
VTGAEGGRDPVDQTESDGQFAVEVAIVGGGPVGLTASLLLSQLGVSHALFERHEGTSIYPRAVSINQRTMEVFRGSASRRT